MQGSQVAEPFAISQFSQEQLFAQFEKLIYYAASNYARRYSWLDYDELVSSGYLIFSEYYNKCRTAHKPFIPQFLKSQIWWGMIAEKDKGAKYKIKFVELDEWTAVDEESFDDIINSVDYEHLRTYLTEIHSDIYRALHGDHTGFNEYVRESTAERGTTVTVHVREPKDAIAAAGIPITIRTSAKRVQKSVKLYHFLNYFKISRETLLSHVREIVECTEEPCR